MKASSQLEQRLLVLVTLALVAFGLVMVFSATSASAALGNGDPITFLKRQGVYALLGVGLMVAGVALRPPQAAELRAAARARRARALRGRARRRT